MVLIVVIFMTFAPKKAWIFANKSARHPKNRQYIYRLTNMKIALLSGLTVATCFAIQAAAPAARLVPPAASTNAFITNAPLSNPEAASVIKNDLDKLSYSFGLSMGSQIKGQE